MALQPWRTGRIIRIENETDNTRRFWIEIPELESFDFTPGQFVTLDLPIHEKPNKRVRSYSIASWPDGTTAHVDTIILATGYRPDLPYLQELGAIDSAGRPHHRNGISTNIPGLGFVGLEYQRSISSATLRGVGRDAQSVLRRLTHLVLTPTARTSAGHRPQYPGTRPNASRFN